MKQSPFQSSPSLQSVLSSAVTFITTSQIITYTLLLLIVAMGALFRFTGVNWDNSEHLHPDERFLSMVTNDLQWPDHFNTYFDPTQSPLSPYAHNKDVWYVYGTLPIYLVKWVTVTIDKTSFDEIPQVGRVVSGMFDVGCIFFIFLIGQRLYHDKVGLLGAAFYAMAAHPIQLSHFYAVDTFANFFVMATVYWAVRASERGNWWFYLLMGLSLGAGMASKMSVLTLGVVVLCTGMLDFYRCYQRGHSMHEALEHIVVRWATVAFVMLVVFRLLQPTAFRGPSFFNFALYDKWVADMKQMQDSVTGVVDAPPFVQWAHRIPLWFPWKNMVLWGLGVPLGIAAWAGWLIGAYELLRYRKVAHLLPVIYVGAAFFYHGTQWVMYMRYFMPIYPLLALLAGYCIVWTCQQATALRQHQRATAMAATRPRILTRYARVVQAISLLLMIIVPIGTLLYALAFVSIYQRTTSRIVASRWMYANIPKGSVLANEHWDDWLPLRIDGKDAYRDWYTGIEMENYNYYTPEKLTHMVQNIRQADYIVLSSSRLYGTITRLPLRYPIATHYYELLFAEKLGFRKIAEFTSYPQLFGIALPDQSADESFSVYDHPKVTIFQKTTDYSEEHLRFLLEDGIDWYTIIHLKPIEATKAPTGLMLMKEDRSIYQQAGTWSYMFNVQSLSNRLPLLWWFLAIELIGLLAFPLCFVAFHRLPERGFALSKAIGLLLVGWSVWFGASIRWFTFSQTTIILALLVLLLVAGIVLAKNYHSMKHHVKQHWQTMLFIEGLFWLLFAIVLVMRWMHPALWHSLDVETYSDTTPMTLAYLNATIKSPYFPPYDPWLSGGYLNEPYFGLLLIALVTKLTAIVPTVAYNMAVPTWFALSGSVVYSIVSSLTAGWHNSRLRHHLRPPDHSYVGQRGTMWLGLFAIVLLLVAGNLFHVSTLFHGLHDIAAYRDAVRVMSLPNVIPDIIVAFPFFRFLQADMQPGVLVLPFILLAIAAAVHIIRDVPTVSVASTITNDTSASPPAQSIWQRGMVLFLVALVIGALAPLNTWAMVVGAGIVGGALFIRAYMWVNSGSTATSGTPDMVMVGWSGAWRLLTVVGIGYLLFLPFHQWYASPYAGITRWHDAHITPTPFLTMHGLFVFIIATYLLTELFTHTTHGAMARLVRCHVRYVHRSLRVRRLHHALVQRPLLWYELALYGFFSAGAFIAILLVFQQWLFAVLFLLLVLTIILAVDSTAEPQQLFVLLLIAMGLMISIAADIWVFKAELDGIDVDRAGTLALFYPHIWLVWSIASAAAMAPLIHRLWFSSPRAVPNSAKTQHTPRTSFATVFPTLFSGTVGLMWWLSLVAFIGISLHYSLFATLNNIANDIPTQAANSGDVADTIAMPTTSTTLDGMHGLQTTTQIQYGMSFDLQWDYEAIRWLQDMVKGSPVIVEAADPPHSWVGRVSAYSGLPTVMGWLPEQEQQRAIIPRGILHERLHDIDVLYTDPDPSVALSIIRKHTISYIYVGALERMRYGSSGIEKFESFNGTYWQKVYTNTNVAIYEVLSAYRQ